MKQLIALPSCRRLACTPSRPMQTVRDICTLALEILLSTSPAVHTRAWGPKRGGFRKNLSKRQLVKDIRSASYRHTHLPLSCAGVKLILTLLNFLTKLTAISPESTLRASIVGRGNWYFISVFLSKSQNW